jgi:DNA-binding NarL/FixJ family response regulator
VVSTRSRIHIKGNEIRQDQFNILLIEDNDADVIVMQTHIARSRDFRLHTVELVSQAIECLESMEFDIILLDLNLPDSIGLEGLIKLRQVVGQIPIVVLTGVNDETLGIMALQRGAQDYLIKSVDNDRLLRSMRYAIERFNNVSGFGIRSHDFENGKSQRGLVPGSAGKRRVAAPKQPEALTERELQVLRLLGKGSNNQEIATILVLSLTTVKTHISKILQKLSVADRTKAVIKALYYGLI